MDLNGQWIGPSQGTIIHSDPDFSRPAYFVMGGNVGMQWQRFDLSLFVTNLLDQHKVLQRPNIALVEYGVTVRPRTVGWRATIPSEDGSLHTYPLLNRQSCTARSA